jgi:hypothetical protein
MIAQAMIELFFPAVDGVGFQAVGAAQLDDRRAGLPLLKDGELLLGGNAAPAAAFNSWTLVHLHKVIQAFQSVQISTGADQDFTFCSTNKPAKYKWVTVGFDGKTDVEDEQSITKPE